ncbi:MAG: nucleotidyl transferase AbiEii/AbiGii toxin family protein [Bacteroidetes bacterium]|nr:nucleotidyl transferase AbiEii/AbiGii toxin family protein [Bacteroidota bacterium]
MLHTKAVESRTLGVIQSLCNKDYMHPYLLVGGTALALQIGHRTSTDIDFFINHPHDTNQLLINLKNDFLINEKNAYRHALFVDVEGIKTDIVYQKCNIIDEPKIIDGVKMASLKEIAPMKLLALTNRGRKRDFIDIYFLMKEFTLERMLFFFKEKFENDNFYLITRSLIYFEDADKDHDLKYFFNETWNEIKKYIVHEVKEVGF